MIWGLERQFRRRLLVIVCALAGLAQLGAMSAIYAGMVSKWAGLSCVIFLVGTFVGGLALMNEATKNYGIQCENADERNRSVRDSAYRQAYLWLTSGMFLFTIYVSLGFSRKLAGKLWVPQTGDDWSLLGWAIIYTGIMLPQGIIAWREPDPPVDDEAAGHPSVTPAR